MRLLWNGSDGWLVVQKYFALIMRLFEEKAWHNGGKCWKSGKLMDKKFAEEWEKRKKNLWRFKKYFQVICLFLTWRDSNLPTTPYFLNLKIIIKL